MKYGENFSSIGEILGSTLDDGAEYSIASRYAVFFTFWGDIVGKKFSSTSKPYSIKGNKLYVMCKNSLVVQELNMYKRDILKKILPYAKGVNLEIGDIVFSYKNWCDFIKENESVEEAIYELNVNDIEIDSKTKDDVFNIISKLTFLNDSQMNKIYLDILNNIKVLKHRENF